MTILQPLVDFVSQRARTEGAHAFYVGQQRHAPQRFGTYAGAWTDGWDEAALEAKQAPIPCAA